MTRSLTFDRGFISFENNGDLVFLEARVRRGPMRRA
jgi:hypothetical protein